MAKKPSMDVKDATTEPKVTIEEMDPKVEPASEGLLNEAITTLMTAGKRGLPPIQRVYDAFMELMHSYPSRETFLSAMKGVTVSPRMLWFAMTAGRG